MNTRKRLLALAAMAWLDFATITMAGEATPPIVTLELGAGSTIMLERPFKTVLIGNPEIIDVQTRDERSVLLKPLRPGTTNVVFIDEEGVVIRNVSILVRNGREI